MLRFGRCVYSERRPYQGEISRINIYGQEKEPATYRLAKMNLALRGISHNLGEEADSTFTNDLHKGLYFDYIMANPPFNLKSWYNDNLKNDPRWSDYVTPPDSNANYAWILHMLSHLKHNSGVAGFLLANGALNDDVAFEIRKKLIENDKVEGYQIKISYTSGSREMKIILDNPMEFSAITLPSVGISTLIPVPPSLSGKVGSNYDWTYSVYLENMTKEDYSAYVQECTKAGFSKDVRDYGDSYWADYKDNDDISINVSYEGNNIVYISITGSLNDDYSDYKRKGSIFENNSTSTEKNEEQTPSSTTSSVTTTTAISSTTTATTSSTTTTVVTEPTILSEYEKAFIRDLSNYDIYYMFDEDTNTVINFVTNDTSVMKGTYIGDFSTGVTIDFTSYGDNWYEKLTNSSGSKATLIDGNGFEWDYEICDVAKAQSVLDDL